MDRKSQLVWRFLLSTVFAIGVGAETSIALAQGSPRSRVDSPNSQGAIESEIWSACSSIYQQQAEIEPKVLYSPQSLADKRHSFNQFQLPITQNHTQSMIDKESIFLQETEREPASNFLDGAISSSQGKFTVEAAKEWAILGTRAKICALEKYRAIRGWGASQPAKRTAVATPANLKDEVFSRANSLLQAGNLADALPLLENGASMGDPRAQYVLAIILSNGLVPKDLPRARSLMRLAAAQNLPQAVARLPKLEELAAEIPTQNDVETVSLPDKQPDTIGMIPEVARAYNKTTDPAIRARIVRKAPLYARSRPSLVVRANVGSNCIRADMINYEFDATREIWLAETRFKNICSTNEIVFVEDQMQNAGNTGMPITNVGRFFGKWDRRRDPNVGFKPYNLDGDIPRYRFSAGAELTAGQGFYYNDPNNLLELWIGSCPARSKADVAQVAFRPAANLRDDPRIACVRGIQGAKEF